MNSDGTERYNDHDSMYTISNADPEATLNYIKKSNYGEHNLIVYPCLGQFEELYREGCKNSILEKDEIFVVITHYQHVSAVRKKMNVAGIDTEKYENEGKLLIVDSEIAYQTTTRQSSPYNIHDLVAASIKEINTNHGKGVTLLTDLGTFILNNRIPDLVSYEASLPRMLDLKVKAFCCYHKDDFNILRQEQMKTIFSRHSINLFIA